MGIRNQAKQHKKLSRERMRIDNVRMIFLIQGWSFILLSVCYDFIAMILQKQFAPGYGTDQVLMFSYGILWVWAGRKV